MLNEYQFQLVECLVEHEADFIVIGGIASKFHTGKATRDLDLWVPVTGGNKERLAQVLKAWSERYKSHCPIGGLEIGKLRENVQIHFPNDDALYLDAAGIPQPICCDDGVDLLTSVRCCLEFDVALKDCSAWVHRGVTLQVLALEHVEMLRRYINPN